MAKKSIQLFYLRRFLFLPSLILRCLLSQHHFPGYPVLKLGNCQIAKKFNLVVLLEKIHVPPQYNSSMTQDSDLFLTPKRPSKLSLSYTRKNLNCKKNPILRAATFLRTYCLPPLEHLQLWGKVHLLLLTVKILS